MSPAGLARRNRLGSLAGVAGVLLAFRVVLPDAQERAPALYVLVVSLGYGHLLGAVVFARERMARLAPAGVPGWLAGALAACSAASLFALYLGAVASAPALVLVLLGLAVWHAVENDLLLGRTYANGFRTPPLTRRSRGHLLASGLAVLALSPFAAFALGRAAIHFADLFAASILYHVVSWFALYVDRARAAGGAGGPRLLRRLLAVHALPAAACVALVAAPLDWDHAARVWVFSPAAYLFWSVLHVGQTLALRWAPLSSPAGRAPSSTARAAPS